MIELQEKASCCGCGACAQTCPKQCITMQVDNEGFYYPKVDLSSCVNCGLCEKTCPLLNTQDSVDPLHVYASKNKDKEILRKSSSGGIFSCLAQKVIEQGGVVFGARFDEQWNVIHDYTESHDGLKNFLSSKYVQSRIGSTYQAAKKFLDQGKRVLYSGTPCQIAGLHRFLKKDYENLYTVDFLCHGVPSPKVWNLYHNQIRDNLKKQKNDEVLFKNISFRDKPNGWLDFNLSLAIQIRRNEKLKEIFVSSSHRKNPYMRGFLNNLYLRPSCHACKFKRFQSHSDITMADFWGIGRVNLDFYDPMGVSMLFVNSKKGADVISLSCTQLDLYETDFESTLSNNGLKQKVEKHPRRDYFFANIDKTTNIQRLIYKCVGPSLLRRTLSTIKDFLK